MSISYLLERGAIPSDFHIVPGGPGVRDVRGMIAWPRTEQTPDGPRYHVPEDWFLTTPAADPRRN